MKTPRQLLDLYYRSVGRGGSFLLNVPPDQRGLLGANDLASLKAFGGLISDTFRANLAGGASAKASNVRGNSSAFDPRQLLDGKRNTYWSTDDGVTTPEVVLTLPREVRFNVIRLREYIELGQRVEAFELDRPAAGAWEPIAHGTSIGACRIVRTDQDITTNRVRLRITRAAAGPALSDLGLFLEV